MKDRKGQRITGQKEVIVRDDDQNYSCQLTDISATGISVTTWHFIPTYKEIAVLMKIDEKRADEGERALEHRRRSLQEQERQAGHPHPRPARRVPGVRQKGHGQMK